MRDIFFNGKFLSAPPTGVHRVAEELIRAVDARLAETGEFSAAILHPRGVLRQLPLACTPHLRTGGTTGPLWEQTELPRAAEGGLLVNLCNLGPVTSRRAITLIHDAQVRDARTSYSAPFRAYYNAIQPVLGRRNLAICTVSEFARDALVRHRIAPKDRIHVMPNGADHVRRTAPDEGAARRHGLAPGRYALALASAQPHKNIAMLIRAFRDPALSGATLALFGDDPPEAIGRDIPANVVFLGRVSDAELFGLMRDCFAFASPSLTEGFGLPPLEAMAAGAPVVAAPRGAMPEILGEAAVYADPHDPGQWARALAALRSSPDERRLRAELGRARARGYAWRGAADILLSLIREKAAARCAA